LTRTPAYPGSTIRPNLIPRTTLVAVSLLLPITGVGVAESYAAAVPNPTAACIADLDRDGHIGSLDLLLVVEHWGGPEYDIDGSGAADAGDIVLVYRYWNDVCCSECADGIDNDGDGRVDWGFTNRADADCASPYDAEAATIDLHTYWNRLPDFDPIPGLTVVYQGPPPQIGGRLAPLKHGFTHMTPWSTTQRGRDDLAPSQRAHLWTGIPTPHSYFPVTFPDEYPWELIKSPWNNSIGYYEQFWATQMQNLADDFPDTRGKDLPDIDIIIGDIEWSLDDPWIIQIKWHPLVPQPFRELPAHVFRDWYKKDMAWLYDRASIWLRQAGFEGGLGSYGDVPIKAFIGELQERSFEEWTTDTSLLNYRILDYTDPDSFYEHPGPMYDKYDYVAVSRYLYYAYPERREDDPPAWRRASHNLMFNVATVELNKAWDQSWGYDKDMMLFQWLLYRHDGTQPHAPLEPHLAHAMSIFPYFFSADAVWLWDHGNMYEMLTGPERYSNYETYAYGLYRLAQYREYFGEDHEDRIYAPADVVQTFGDLFQPQEPVWRGIIHPRGDRMLVAAYAPDNEPGDTSSVRVMYGGGEIRRIILRGQETFLGEIELPPH
jgi:hypothetical protein